MSREALTKLAHAILLDGIRRGARTIELRDDGFQVRLMYCAHGMWVEGMSMPVKLHALVVETLAEMAGIEPHAESFGWFDLIIGSADKVRYHFDLQVRSSTTFRITLGQVPIDPWWPLPARARAVC